jgi:hypothetical protein
MAKRNKSKVRSRAIHYHILLECSGMRPRAVIALLACSLASMTFCQTSTPNQTAELNSLRQRAEEGDIKAQSELGFMYEFGTGAAQDYAEALKWYHRADDKQGIARMYFEGKGVTKDYAEAARWYGCPKPSVEALASCTAISYKDLPREALDLLKRMKCDLNSTEDYGSAVDLNGDGVPEYEVCCKESAHGPCDAVVIGKVASTWKDLTPKDGVLGYDNACGFFIVLNERHGGFNDVCRPDQCSTASLADGKNCVPTIWQFVQGRYRSVEYTPVPPPN